MYKLLAADNIVVIRWYVVKFQNTRKFLFFSNIWWVSLGMPFQTFLEEATLCCISPWYL